MAMVYSIEKTSDLIHMYYLFVGIHPTGATFPIGFTTILHLCTFVTAAVFFSFFHSFHRMIYLYVSALSYNIYVCVYIYILYAFTKRVHTKCATLKLLSSIYFQYDVTVAAKKHFARAYHFTLVDIIHNIP